MKVNIYGIINPITKEIVYIGQTPSNLDYYIKTKYWKLNEVKRGRSNIYKYIKCNCPYNYKGYIIKRII